MNDLGAVPATAIEAARAVLRQQIGSADADEVGSGEEGRAEPYCGVSQAVRLTLPFSGAVVAAGVAEVVPALAGARGRVTCWPRAFAVARICLPRADKVLASIPRD